MKATNIVIKQGEKIIATAAAEGEFEHRKVIRFSSLEPGSDFEDLAGNKWVKLDEVQAAAPLLPSLTKENFPAEQLVYIWQPLKEYSQYCCPTCGWEPPETDGTAYRRKRKNYPIYSKERKYYNGSYDMHDWDETHYCSKCAKEFIFSNGAV